ncbi:Uma2 family endonuclease [Candidatus Entotheonella palauensis]|uniref:Uma2 family endonuclease n=1 Tax=Candidatus Entotheonella palauensis TaxID=93172 RepID=UPI000B7CC8B9|nr:Uma2 family endonuclease [Candidatus Entotheonella palauensis]
MVSSSIPEQALEPFPDHTQLPESDGTFVKNFQGHPQSMLLTDSIQPVLRRRHPDGQYCIGQDSGIYWRQIQPPERGAEAPDWFYVANVPPDLDGVFRRSYVLWRELIRPFIILEFVSGDGREERDQTPWQGKFWIYEQVIRPAYYGIYEVMVPRVELYQWVGGQFQLLPANSRGHFEVTPLGVELGLWDERYQNVELPWLRWWDDEGNLLLTGEERAEQEHQRAEQEHQRAEQERQRAERLAALLREQGIEFDDPWV